MIFVRLFSIFLILVKQMPWSKAGHFPLSEQKYIQEAVFLR